MSNQKEAKNILRTICNSQCIDLTYSEAKEALIDILYHLDNNEDSSTIELPCSEYLLINDEEIWGIYVSEIKSIVEDCYDLNLGEVPDFVALTIDWEETAENAYVDGYGHTFSSYDGSEEYTDNTFIFRTN